MEIELLSTNITDFDRIVGTGPVTLGGVLKVTLVGGFLSVAGDTFDIILGFPVSGSFDSTVFPVLPGRSFTIVPGTDFLRLQVVVPIPSTIYLLSPAIVLLFRRRAAGT